MSFYVSFIFMKFAKIGNSYCISCYFLYYTLPEQQCPPLVELKFTAVKYAHVTLLFFLFNALSNGRLLFTPLLHLQDIKYLNVVLIVICTHCLTYECAKS